MACGGLVERARQDGLDRDPAVERGVEAVVDQAHRAFSEHAADLVAAKGLQFGLEFVHERSMILGGSRLIEEKRP